MKEEKLEWHPRLLKRPWPDAGKEWAEGEGGNGGWDD